MAVGGGDFVAERTAFLARGCGRCGFGRKLRRPHLQTEAGVFLFTDARTDDQAAGQFQFQAEHHAEKIGLPQDRAMPARRGIRRDLHGVWTKTDSHFLAVDKAVRGKFQFLESAPSRCGPPIPER